MSWRYALSFSPFDSLEIESEMEETLVLNDFNKADVESDAENANLEREPEAVSRDAHCENTIASDRRRLIGRSNFCFIFPSKNKLPFSLEYLKFRSRFFQGISV